MATVNSITFDAASYDSGATVSASVNFTPDAPSVSPTTFTLTASLHDAAGNEVATNTAPFVVNVASPSADTLSVSDDGNHTWTVGAAAAQGDGSETSVCTTTA